MGLGGRSWPGSGLPAGRLPGPRTGPAVPAGPTVTTWAQERLEGYRRALRDALLSKGWKEERSLKYFEAAGAEHNERAWEQRVGPMLRFLFPRK